MPRPFEPIVRKVRVRGQTRWEVDARAWPETMHRMGEPKRPRFDSRDQAAAHRSKLIRMEATGERSAPGSAVVRQLSDLYLASVERGEMATTTYRTYESRLGVFLRFLAEHRISQVADVSPTVLEAWKLDLLGRVRPVTASSYMAAVSAMFAWAVRLGILDANPAANVSMPRGKARRRAFTADERRTLLREAGPELRPLWMFLLLTGLRRAELHRLTTDDLVLDTPAPFVRVLGKGDKRRIVPLEPPEPLGAARILHDRAVDGRIIPYSYWRLGEVWRIERDRIGLPSELTLHSFRHTCATMLANADEPLPMGEIKEFLGHHSVRVTETYVHRDERRMRRGLRSVGGSLVSDLVPAPGNAEQSGEST